MVAPVFKLGIGKQPDVGKEQTDIKVDAMQLVEVIPRVRFAQIAVDTEQIELTAIHRQIVARHGRGARPKLGEYSCSDIPNMEIATDSCERQRQLVVTRRCR